MDRRVSGALLSRIVAQGIGINGPQLCGTGASASGPLRNRPLRDKCRQRRQSHRTKQGRSGEAIRFKDLKLKIGVGLSNRGPKIPPLMQPFWPC